MSDEDFDWRSFKPGNGEDSSYVPSGAGFNDSTSSNSGAYPWASQSDPIADAHESSATPDSADAEDDSTPQPRNSTKLAANYGITYNSSALSDGLTSMAPPDRMFAAQQRAPLQPPPDYTMPSDWPRSTFSLGGDSAQSGFRFRSLAEGSPTATPVPDSPIITATRASSAASASPQSETTPPQPRATSLYGGLPAGDPYLSDVDGRWKQPMRDGATGVTGDLDLLHAGLSWTDRDDGSIYADSSQGPIRIGIDEHAAALAQIVQRREQDDPDDDLANDGPGIGSNYSPSNPDQSTSANARQRLAQIQTQIQSYGGIPQRLEARVAALQAGLTGGDPDDPGAQSARQSLALAQSALTQWKQDHPEYAALIREQSSLQASIQSQQDSQAQSDAQTKASLAMPETVRMNGTLPLDPMPALGPGDASLADVQQRAGDLAGQMQISPSAALRAALVEARNRGAITVGGADINAAIRNARPTQLPSTDPATLSGAHPLIFRVKDVGAAIGQGLTRPVAGVLGAVAVGEHLLTGKPLDQTVSKDFADAINDYWNEAREPEYKDSALSKVAEGAASMVPTMVAEYYGGPIAGHAFNALSMGGEAMLEAKEKGWSDGEAMEMFGLNLGFGALGGQVISRSLKRINALTGGSLSKYVLALSKDSAPRLGRLVLGVGQSAVEGGLVGAIQTFGSEAWAKLRNLGDAGQREWADILNDAKSAGVQNALTMVLTSIFVAGAVPRAQRQQLAENGRNETPPILPSPDSLSSSPSSDPEGESTSSTPEEVSPQTKPLDLDAKPVGPLNAGADEKADDSPSSPSSSSESLAQTPAQRVADLHAKVRTLREKIAAIHEDPTPEGAGELGAHLDDERTAQAQLHTATQDLVASVPERIRGRIERASGPGLDYDEIRERNSEDPTHAFATAEVGNAMRRHYLATITQRGIRWFAELNGTHPALADRIADQTVGAQVVRDLAAVVRREPIDLAKARALKKMGLLKNVRTKDGTTRATITDDALPLLPPTMQFAAKNPRRNFVAHTNGRPADGLNRIAAGGRQRFADTAKAIELAKTNPTNARTISTANLRKILLKASGFEEHHIISNKNSATRNHPLLKLAGFDLESQFNKIWLPKSAEFHPSRSIHEGKHFQAVSDNIRLKMDAAKNLGIQKGWSKVEYATALKRILAEERALLRSGKRRLNKNARSYSK